MKLWAWLFSLCAHLAVVAVGLYFQRLAEYPLPGDNLVIEAPLGEVFVQEEASPGERAKAANAAPAPPTESDASFPSEVKQASEAASFANTTPGVPEGEAMPIGKIQPVYPALSRKMGEQGEAVFLLGIDADGTVTSATLERSSGHERLDDAARSALLVSRFQPPVSQGQPVLSLKRFRIEFRLDSAARKH